VRVYPHGSPHLATTGKVLILSSNERSIAVGFEDKPRFAILREGVLIHPTEWIVMMAGREELNGKPWGPWIETFNGGHYEIEEINFETEHAH
jgi:hypothetical protein